MWLNKWVHKLFLQCRSRSFFNLKPMSVIVLPVSNSQVHSNDEFDLWAVYSGERFRAFRPSCLQMCFGTNLKDSLSDMSQPLDSALLVMK